MTMNRSRGFSGGRNSGGAGRSGGGNDRFGGGRGRSFAPRRGGQSSRSTLDISSFINKAVVSTETVAHFVPDNAFADFAIDARIKKLLEQRGYTHPTPIQDKTIPHILKGEDVVGLANTGTGKTAAFLIPLIDKIIKGKGEQVLILAPTRELAIQIEDEFSYFAKALGMNSTVCVGGAPIGPQIAQLRRRNHLIIGTPGRMIDLIKRGNLKLEGIRNIVLDEADRMLDMGFINDIRFILAKTPKERLTLCFSATMAPEIKKLVSDFMIAPVTISVKTQDVSKNINQEVVKVAGRDKVELLAGYLRKSDFGKVIVFGRTKHGVERLSRDLNKLGFNTESIHGNKSHPQRVRALTNFKQGRAQALIATDVAARGLDISGVTHVINYDVPMTYDDYVHRIGRTGRADQTGQALTFVG